MNQAEPVKPTANLRRPDFLLFALLAAVGIGRFFQKLPPLVGETEQIVNTAILLLVLVSYLIYDFRPGFAGIAERARASGIWGACGLALAGSSFFPMPAVVSLLLLFSAKGCFLRAALGRILSSESGPLLNAVFVAFTVFGGLLVTLPIFDLPLRMVAGKWSAQVLIWMQQDTHLEMVRQQGESFLLLFVNGRPFHVAAECNGFGLLGTSLILNAAFILYRRVGWFDAAILLVAGVFLAVVGNLLRILVIVWLAPSVGEHYLIMHEIVGTIVFYSCLALQWWLLTGYGKSPGRVSAGDPEDSSST